MSDQRPSGCVRCAHIEQDYDEGYGASVWCNKTNFGNLKSFPFKKEMSCFELNPWHDKNYDPFTDTPRRFENE
jgi:hypothetical protein